METIHRGEAYNTEFDPKVYISTCVFSDHELVEQYSQFQFYKSSKTFAEGEFTGPRLLEIGGGPNIANAILACERFSEIVFSDFSEPCRQAVRKWVNDEPDAIDWSQFIRKMCEMYDSGVNWEDRQKKVRQSIKEIIHCDVLKARPLEPKVYEPFDAIITSLCIEAVCPDKESYKKSLKAITSLLKPGGTLIMYAVTKETFYAVGEKKFYCLDIDEGFIKATLTEAGYDITTSELMTPAKKDQTASDFGGVLYLVAVKNK